MNTKLCVGDLVKSLKGRDEGCVFLVVDVRENKATIVDGKTRKLNAQKTKNIKHLIKLKVDGLSELATEIQSGKIVGNSRVYKLIAQKIKED